MTILIIGIILFLGTHLLRVFVPGLRAAMVERLGLGGWRGLHSALSVITLVILIYGYAVAPVINLYFHLCGWRISR